MEIREAVKLALEIFKEILGDKFDIQRFNIAYIKKDEEKLRKLTREETRKYK